MFEGLLGGGEVVGALSKNVNQDFGMPVINYYYMVPYGLDEGHLLCSSSCVPYRNTIASSPPGERIFIFFEKIRFASQKLNFSILP
jgi:hypothetical protein